jgi:hypothetical protein
VVVHFIAFSEYAAPTRPAEILGIWPVKSPTMRDACDVMDENDNFTGDQIRMPLAPRVDADDECLRPDSHRNPHQGGLSDS